MIIKDQTTIKKKYYYYVAVLSKGRDIIHIKGTYGTTKDDFPLHEVEKHILEDFVIPTDSIVITFYKEITKENYKSYNNEQ
jgi:hypothetical protein